MNLPRWQPYRTYMEPFDPRLDCRGELIRLKLTRDDIQKEAVDCHWCQLYSFPNSRQYPVRIVNDIDNAELPKDFKFSNHSVLRAGVHAAEAAFRTGCECENDRECEFEGCECLQDMDVSHMKGRGGRLIQYHTAGHNKGCLREEMLESSAPIYECQVKCRCSKDCSNRIVSRGRMVPLDIFRTADGRGWGTSIYAIRSLSYG
jgi:histone-lysine N-methyltransferase SUV39H